MTARRITHGVIRVAAPQPPLFLYSWRRETADRNVRFEDTRRDHDLWSLLCKNLRHTINFPFAKGESLCLLFIMVEAKRSDSVDRVGQDKVEDGSNVYTVSSEERSGHWERLTANHSKLGSEDVLRRSPAITECHKVSRVMGEATCARTECANAQGNDERQMGEIDGFYTRKDFHAEVGVPAIHDIKEAPLQIPRAVPMPTDSTPYTDGQPATMEQGNAMNPLGKLLAKVTLDAVDSQGKCLREMDIILERRSTWMILSGDRGSAGQTDFTMATLPPVSRVLGRISRDEQSPILGVRYLKIPDEQNPTKEGSGDDDTSLLDIRVTDSNVSGVTV
jgi:hypothetical protein